MADSKVTAKQREYAQNIAKRLNISLPEDDSKAAYQAFIKENQERFKQAGPAALHYTQEQIDRANRVSIVDYARSCGLELKKDGKNYRVKNYAGGFIITPEKNNWNWFAGNQGGGVVQLCMFLENKTWQEAVGALINEDMEPIRLAKDWKPEPEPPKEFHLPEKNDTDKHVYAYLTKTRGIDADIVKDMLGKGYIFENKQRSCVFVGRDKEGVPRHASVRSTNTTGKAYKKDVSGSQKKHSFSIKGTSGRLNVFEAPIDLLSFMSLQKMRGEQVNDSYVALGGVSDKALEQFLTDHEDIQVIRICTDGDEAGEKAADEIRKKYGEQHEIIRQLPEHKDFNEDLVDVRKEMDFEKNLYDLLMGNRKLASHPLTISKTPNALAICGANGDLDMTIKKSTVDKCLRPEIRDENGKLQGKTGHGLTQGQLLQALKSIKNPVMVLEGSHKDSLVAVTDLKDDRGRELLVAIQLNKSENFEEVNSITSAYGRENFSDFLDRQISNGKILAVNTEKADKMLHSIGKKYPKENAPISYDNTIAYTLENVKYPEKEPEKNEEQPQMEHTEKKEGEETMEAESKNAQQKKVQVAIESTIDFEDREVGFTRFATENMPSGTKYRLVTYGEDGLLVPYQDASAIYNERKMAEAYIDEHTDEVEAVNYDDMVKLAGAKHAEHVLEQKRLIEKGMHDFRFDDKGYLHFSIRVNGGSHDGLYRIYDPENGKNRELVSIDNGVNEPFLKENWERIREYLKHYVNNHPAIGENGEVIPRETPCIYCEWSEHDAFEDGKMYSVSDFNERMKQADTKWQELRRQEREQYGENAFEELLKLNLPQHQTYAKVKYTVYVPGLEELTLRQDVGDGFKGVIDYIQTTQYKHYVEPLKDAVLRELNQELDDVAQVLESRTRVEEQAWQLQSEMRYEEANALLDTLEQNEKIAVEQSDVKDSLNNLENLQESGGSRRFEKVRELPEYPVRPEKKNYHNDEEWKQAVEKYRKDNGEFNELIEHLAEEHIQNNLRFSNEGEFVQWLSENGYAKNAIKGIDLKAASDFAAACERVLKIIPEMEGKLFTSISLEKPQKKNAVAWVNGDKDLHLSNHLFKDGMYSEVIKSELFHTAQGYYPKGADPFLHVYIHEMGHSVESVIAEKIGGKEKLWSELGNLFNVKVDIGEDLPYISGYGNETYGDWFAEMFSAYVNGGMDEDVLKFRGFIKEYLKDELELTEKSFAQQVDEVLAGRADRYSDIKVCDTPDILIKVGCDQLPIFYTQSHLRDAIKPKGDRGEAIHHHGLEISQIKKLPELLSDPVMIYDTLSQTRSDSLVIVTSEVDGNNNPIVVVIRPNGTAHYDMEIVESNFLLSAHGRNNFENQMDKAVKQDKLLYCNKQKSQELFSVLGLQLSQGFNNLDFDKIIHQSNNIVKAKKSEIGKTEDNQSFVLTDTEISSQMKDILERLALGETVQIDEINATKEIQYCRSIADNGRETYLLEGRQDKQNQVMEYMDKLGSASGRLDRNGKMIYDGVVRKGSRLDIVIGLPGAGKSSALVDVISQEFHSKVIDNDVAKEQFTEYQNGLGAKLVHKESQMVCERVLDNALLNHENVVLPKVGSNTGKLFDNIIASAKERGYEINVHFVDLGREKALGRMLGRLISTGRFLDPMLIDKYCPDKEHNRCEQSYEALKLNELISGYSRWDNNVEKGEQPYMVESHNLTGEYINNARVKENEKGVVDNDRIGLRNNGDSRQSISKDMGENGRIAEASLRGVHEGSSKNHAGRRRELQGAAAEELKTENLIKLQGVPGHHKGTQAKELKIGDVLVWNGGETSEVVGMEPSKTGKTIVFQMKSTQDGTVRDRRMKAETLVVVQNENLEQIPQEEQKVDEEHLNHEADTIDNNVTVTENPVRLQETLEGIEISDVKSNKSNTVDFKVNLGDGETHAGEAGFDEDGIVNFILVDPMPESVKTQGEERRIPDIDLQKYWDKIVDRVKQLLQEMRYKGREFVEAFNAATAAPQFTTGAQYENMRNAQGNPSTGQQPEQGTDSTETIREQENVASKMQKNKTEDIKPESVQQDMVSQYKDFAKRHKEMIKASREEIATDAKKRIPIVINAYGGPGAGKSVSCMDICQKLNKMGYNAELVQEYAKDLVYDGNMEMLDGSAEHQFEILKEQLRRMDRLYGKVDFIVIDSPLLLNGVYNKEITPEYSEMIDSLSGDFRNFTYFVERDTSSFQQEGRIHNMEESQKIDQDIKKLLSQKGIYYGTYDHDTIGKVVNNVISTFNRVNNIEEPATERQTAYAKKLAGALGIELPAENTKSAYKAFIEENQDAFSNSGKPLVDKETQKKEYPDYLEMVTKNGSTLKDVPKEHYTEELLLAAVTNWGAAIRMIPEDKLTPDIALASVRQYGLNLKHVPERLRSEEVCIAAYINSSGKSIRYTPNELKGSVKEKGKEELSKNSNVEGISKRQMEADKLQEQGQEWISRIGNMLKEHEADAEAMVEDIAFAAKFYQYSPKNVQLMLQQNPHMTYVASKADFEKMGYHVKDGENAMIARVPEFSRYIIDEKGERVYSGAYTPEMKQKIKEGKLKEEQTVRNFKYTAAFYDISQTDCPAEDYPSVYHMGIPSELHKEAFDAMKEFAEKSLGFRVMVTDLKSISLRGSCSQEDKIIRINDKLEPTMALSTLCHEIGHAIIHTAKNAAKATTAQKECEADVMDIMLESSLGLPINESRREHLFKAFHTYKDEQAAKEQPYNVTLENLIDRVQKKVFRPYTEDILRYLDLHLPAEGKQSETIVTKVIKNIALLDVAYQTDHQFMIDEKHPLFDKEHMDEYQELYKQTMGEYRLSNSLVPKLAVLKMRKGVPFLFDVRLVDDKTVGLVKSWPENSETTSLKVEVGDLLVLKENVMEPPRVYLVNQYGLEDKTHEMPESFRTMEHKINCDFDVKHEYECIHNLLENNIELKSGVVKRYDQICDAFGFEKYKQKSTSIQLMAQINQMTEGLSQNNRELVAEYVFRTGNFAKVENWAERLEKEPGAAKQMRDELKLVDSYKYMLFTIAEYENRNDVPDSERITTGAYNSSSIPVLSDNVHSLSQIDQGFLLIQKHAAMESIKYYAVTNNGHEEEYRIAYVELDDYRPSIAYSSASFGSWEEAEEFYKKISGESDQQACQQCTYRPSY